MGETRAEAPRRFGLPFEGEGGDRVRLESAPPRAILNLRGRAADAHFASGVRQALGVALPDAPNRWNGDSETAILWMGPDEWLVLAAPGRAGQIEAQLRGACADDPWFSAVDVSHSYAGLVLQGPAARAVLAKGCPLDLHPRRFGPGDCVQSLLAKSRVLLRATGDDCIEIWLRNSYARYTAIWLTDAMEEFRGID